MGWAGKMAQQVEVLADSVQPDSLGLILRIHIVGREKFHKLSLTSACALWQMCPHRHVGTHKLNK